MSRIALALAALAAVVNVQIAAAPWSAIEATQGRRLLGEFALCYVAAFWIRLAGEAWAEMRRGKRM